MFVRFPDGEVWGTTCLSTICWHIHCKTTISSAGHWEVFTVVLKSWTCQLPSSWPSENDPDVLDISLLILCKVLHANDRSECDESVQFNHKHCLLQIGTVCKSKVKQTSAWLGRLTAPMWNQRVTPDQSADRSPPLSDKRRWCSLNVVYSFTFTQECTSVTFARIMAPPPSPNFNGKILPDDFLHQAKSWKITVVKPPETKSCLITSASTRVPPHSPPLSQIKSYMLLRGGVGGWESHSLSQWFVYHGASS